MTAARPSRPATPFRPVRVLDLDLTRPLSALHGLDGYDTARLLVRHGVSPLGYVDVEIREGACSADRIRAAVRAAGLDRDHPPAAPAWTGPWPPVTVAVCTRDRPEELAECLAALMDLEYPDIDIIVVDNAPATAAGAEICARYPRVRRVLEPRPGLNWARNRAVLEAHGEVLAFTDDDVRVDPSWLRELVPAFLQDDAVMAVAGFAAPVELETPAQMSFETYGGMSGGFSRIRLQGAPDWGARGLWHYVAVALHGSGANMAFRHSVFDQVGLFDPALDVGTPTLAGGDTEMLFRVLAHGHAMVYEPGAVVRHRHRRESVALERQIEGWGSGMFAFLTRSILHFRRGWWVLGLFAARGVGSLLLRFLRPRDVPRRLVLMQLRGAVAGPLRYFRARARAREIARQFGPQKARTAA